MTYEMSIKAGDQWGMNCGPGALCAVFDATPDEIRIFMGDFEKKGYTNPTLMNDTLEGVTKALGKQWRQVYRSDNPTTDIPKVNLGLMRVQWGGRWTNPGVPMQARYRMTHWVGLRDQSKEVFDINAVGSPENNRWADGWLPANVWKEHMVPWILEQMVKGNDGRWWPTHVIEIL